MNKYFLLLSSLLVSANVSGTSLNRHDTDPQETNVGNPPIVTPTTEAPVSPTQLPSSYPMSLPTLYPTNDPTSLPTLSPTNDPTELPTELLTIAPTALPDRRTNCLVDVDGLFGTETDAYELIEFNYEVETSEENPEPAIVALELAFVGSILSAIFPEGCLRRELLRLRSRRLAPVGVSSQPFDLVIEDVSCSIELEDSTNSCFVVDGKMTIYTDGSFSGEGLTTLETLAAKMNDGQFNSAHDSIVRVTYVDFVPQGLAEPETEPKIEETSGGIDRGLGAGAIIGMAAGGALILAAAVFLARRSSASNEE